MEVAVGVALLVLGAVGAASTTRVVDGRARPWAGALAVAPMGLLIGAGAALVRGWDLVATAVVGLLLLPLVAVVSRAVERRADARVRRGQDAR